MFKERTRKRAIIVRERGSLRGGKREGGREGEREREGEGGREGRREGEREGGTPREGDFIKKQCHKKRERRKGGDRCHATQLTTECVLLLRNVFSYYRMCSLTTLLSGRCHATQLVRLASLRQRQSSKDGVEMTE